MTDETLTIDRRYSGPRLTGNGGYVGGMLANRLAADGREPVEITFRAPAPLETPLSIERMGDERLNLKHGETLICEARRAPLDVEPPPFDIDWPQAEAIWRAGGSPEGSNFHECIVCGRGRAEGDGLRVWGGPVNGGGLSWSLYHAHAAHADAGGRIAREFVWGTLDCPGAWAAQDPQDWRPAVTGRLTASILERPRAGERCIVVGWRIGEDGRKLYSGTALYTESGTLCAKALQTWILLKDAAEPGVADRPRTPT
jgi:hypothetical protein